MLKLIRYGIVMVLISALITVVVFIVVQMVFRGARLSDSGSMLASVVGVSASIPENEYNNVARELENIKVMLDEKEKELNERERLLADDFRQDPAETRTIFMGIFGGVLTTLLGLNFAMDWKRANPTDV